MICDPTGNNDGKIKKLRVFEWEDGNMEKNIWSSRG